MGQTYIQIRIDEDLKNSFVRLCDDLGLTITTACCAFIRKAVAEQRIPFELSVPKTKNKEEITMRNYEEIKNTVESKLSEGKKLPLSGVNENGENVVITEGKTENGIHFYSLMTFQKNNWTRVNEYYADGTTTETFEK